jgi:PmbA protein
MNYLQLANDVVKNLAAQGVAAEVMITDSRETEIRVDRGQVEQLAQNTNKGMGVRVIDGGRVGYAYTSDFSPHAVEETARAALELAQIATPDEYRALPDSMAVPDEDLGIYDPELEGISTDQKVELAKKAEALALEAEPRMIQAQSNYGDFIAHVYMANSNGLSASYSRTAAYNYIMGVAKDDSDMAMGFGLSASNTFREVDPAQVAREVVRRATLTLGAKPVPTQTASVVFDPFIMAELLYYLSLALTGEAMQRGKSFLIGRMGKEVGSDKVTLLDNGRMKGGFASAPFDAEGVPTSATRLIDEGVLQAVIYDSYSARRDGARPTGNAQRESHRSLPKAGISNFYIQPGHDSPDEIIASVQNGLYVTRIMQTGGVNPINGDCSMAASGVWIENGQLTHPVNGVTIATTLPDLLNNVSAVGSDLRFIPIFGSIGSPTVRVDNMTIGGTA